jgi:phage terminase large subunit-like protein
LENRLTQNDFTFITDWAKKNFWIPEVRGPLPLQEYQERCLKHIFTVDERGNFPYSIIIWSDIKKSSKSTIAAAVAQYMALSRDYAEIYVIANDLKQADSRVAHYFRRSLELNPDMRGRYRQRGYKTIFDNGSFVEAIPIDPSGEAGSNADAIIYSELWGAHQEAQNRMWTEMTLSPNKFGKSFRWVESYAGYVEESELLFSLWETGTKAGHQIWDDLEAYANDPARMFCLWNTKPRCPWQTDEYYQSEHAVLTDEEFRRMHRNEWVSSTETFVPIEWWDYCQRPMPPPKKYESVIIGLDAGVSDDNFGLVVTARHPDNSEEVVVRYSEAWKPPPGRKINFYGTEESPELRVRKLCKELNVVEICYDPSQMEDMAGRLRREGIAFCKPFSQGQQRLVADSELRAKIRDRRIWHNGNVQLREHINNANAEKDVKEDRKVRIVKRAQHLKIDLCVALSMSAHEVMRLNL